ncbi:MAG: SDR family NAD(P)-dependent oxidoreductase, partial [Eubacteriales bacterium]|nr:SDR family NAD(P)-dependent oxidoreductase [Eubacteriales bacterium]
MKRVLITGANQGIGFHMANQLLADGCQLSVLDLETDQVEQLREIYADRLLAITCDVRDEAAIREAVERSAERFGGIDIAIHNACRCTSESMEETPYSVYQDVLDVNYFGALRLTKAVIPYMEIEGKGKIIFTSSGVGVMGFVNISPYASSKGAIESLAKCMNIEYQDKAITFHLFHPPLTRTKSASALPVPKEFMADPLKVGTGFAKNIDKKSFVICNSFGQKIQV